MKSLILTVALTVLGTSAQAAAPKLTAQCLKRVEALVEQTNNGMESYSGVVDIVKVGKSPLADAKNELEVTYEAVETARALLSVHTLNSGDCIISKIEMGYR